MQNPYHSTPYSHQQWTPPRAEFDDENNFEILLMFYEPQEGDHYFNHIVKSLSSGTFSHVEISFPTYSRKYIPQQKKTQDIRILYGSSIFQNGKVFFHEKQYSRSGYTSIGILTSRHKHDMLIAYCQTAAQKGIKFDGYGMLCACLPIIITPHKPDATFCSKFVTDALQYANISEVNDIDSRNTTPSSLYNHIRSKMHTRSVVTASPARLQQFTSSLSI